MTHLNSDLASVLANVLAEFAFEIDRHYEQEEIARLALTDSTFTTFRGAVQELRKRDVPLSDRVLHVERRIEAATGAGEARH